VLELSSWPFDNEGGMPSTRTQISAWMGAACSILAVTGVYFLALWDARGMQAAMAPSWLGSLPAMWVFLAGVAGAILGLRFGAPNPAPIRTSS
jgi:hypothetical protein